jgi:hypothetical protein
VVWTGLGPVERPFESCNEPSDFIKCLEVPEYLHDWWPLEKGQLHGVSTIF